MSRTVSALGGRLIAAAIAAALVAGCAAEAASGPSVAPAESLARASAPAESLDRASAPDLVAPSAPAAGSPAATASPPAVLAPPPASPPAASPPATASASRPAASAVKRFAMDLFEPGDFVAQYTFEWCVGASLQMALLLTDATSDRSRALQAELWSKARDRSTSPFGGANPLGWTAVLNELDLGPYELVSRPTLEEAVETAAAAIRATERPVGLVMWRGRHAWVMSGFESLGDPRTAPEFSVTHVRVLDPLYPHGSSVWGPSPKPDSRLTLETLGEQFVPRLFGRVDYGIAPGYVLVLPTT